MTKEEVNEFATLLTKADNRTEITYKDDELIVGYFEHHLLLSDENKWPFVILATNEKITLNGDDMKSIRIYQV